VDTGDGLRADQAQAEAMVRAAARLYTPSREAELLAAFRSDKSRTMKTDGLTFSYTYERGAKIDERLITISSGRSPSA
jgi:hypothetical protein